MKFQDLLVFSFHLPFSFQIFFQTTIMIYSPIYSRTTNFLSFFYRSYTCYIYILISQSAITCSKLTIETLEQGVKYVQS